jgi:hypothetical protein
MGVGRRRRSLQRALFCVCGTAVPVWSGMCRSCYAARSRGDSDEGNNVFRSDVDKDQSSAKLGSFMLTD